MLNPLEIARRKLQRKIKGTRGVVPPFSLECLPWTVNDVLWTKIEKKYGLQLDELCALKIFAIAQSMYKNITNNKLQTKKYSLQVLSLYKSQ